MSCTVAVEIRMISCRDRKSFWSPDCYALARAVLSCSSINGDTKVLIDAIIIHRNYSAAKNKVILCKLEDGRSSTIYVFKLGTACVMKMRGSKSRLTWRGESFDSFVLCFKISENLINIKSAAQRFKVGLCGRLLRPRVTFFHASYDYTHKWWSFEWRT